MQSEVIGGTNLFHLSKSPGHYILRVASGIFHQLDSFVTDTSMTPMEARALQFIAAVDGSPLYQKDIEAEYGYTAATVSELIKGICVDILSTKRC